MTPSLPTITVDVGPARVSLCRFDGESLRVHRVQIGPVAEEWPKWLDVLSHCGPCSVIYRVRSDSQGLQDAIEAAALSQGAMSIRFIPDDPDCDPAPAVVRQLGNQLRERDVRFLELGDSQWCCGLIDPAGAVSARSGARFEQVPPIDHIAMRLREAIEARLGAGEARPASTPLLVAYGDLSSKYAVSVASACGLQRVLIPHHAAALPAVGMLIADIVIDLRKELTPGPIDIPVLRRAFAELMDEANDAVTREGYDVDNTICTRWASLAFRGDDESIEVSCESMPDAGTLERLFFAENAKWQGAPQSDSAVELRAIRIRVVVNTPKLKLPGVRPSELLAEAGIRQPEYELRPGWSVREDSAGWLLSSE